MIKKILPVLILLVSLIIFFGLSALRPEAEKEAADEKLVQVKIQKLKAQDLTMIVTGSGQVQSDAEIILSPQIAGRVIFRSPRMQKGSRFSKGELLFQIDPSDYELNYQLAKSDYEKAKIQYDIESEELALLYPSTNDSNKLIPLIARANLNASQTRVKQAKLALDRTKIFAAFDAVCRNKNIDVGQYVTPGTNLGEIFSVEKSIITINVEPSELQFLDAKQQHPAKIFTQTYYANHTWNAYVINRGESLDRRSRLSNISLAIDKPYANEPILLNALYVTVEISGKQEKNVFLIPREAIHDDTVWLNTNNQLEIRPITVIRYQNNYAIIRDNLKNDEELVLSHIEIPLKGMKLSVSEL